MRTTSSLLFTLLLAAGAAAQPDDPNALGAPEPEPSTLAVCENRNTPLVVWDVTGESFLGPVHASLVVYMDGVASVASRGTGDVRTEFVGPAGALALREELIRAGAATLCDQPFATDLPLTTLTVLQGGTAATDLRAHTFSYWHASGEYSEVQARIDDFLARYFPGFSVN